MAEDEEVILPCLVKNCPRAAESKGLCSAHYQRLRRVGDVMADKPIKDHDRGASLTPEGKRKKCSLNGCTTDAHAKGFCHTHWSRYRRNGVFYGDVPIGKLRTHKAWERRKR